jgi:soluble lytic murein transglycosylase-like protein
MTLTCLGTAQAGPIYRYQSEGVTVITNIPRGERIPYKIEDQGGVVRVTAHSSNLSTHVKQKGQQYSFFIQEACSKYRVSPILAWAIMAAESNFDPAAVSSKGAVGLMQLMPKTAKEMQVSDLFDPKENIFGGIRYLRLLSDLFSGDLVKVIAAYNAGPGAVSRAGGIPSIEETEDYVSRVMRFYRMRLE